MEPAPFWSESGRSPHSRLVPAAPVHIDPPGCGPQPRPLILISPAPCMALLGTLVRNQQVDASSVVPALISLCLEVKRVLPSAVKSYHLVLVGSQQWQLLVFWRTSLTSSSKESTLPLAVEFSLNYLWLLGTVINAGPTPG